MRILDLDLDFFLDEVNRGPIKSNRRACSEYYHPWSADAVRKFLREQCGLSSRHPMSGRWGERHEHVYFAMARMFEEKPPAVSFDLVHVDAHADLGLGTVASVMEFICTEVLHVPLPHRAKQIADSKVSEWNWLLFAVANRWLASLTYVYHPNGKGDDIPLCLDNWRETPETLRLARATPEEFRKTVQDRGRGLTQFEPSIPFIRVRGDAFREGGKYERVFVTHSPEYTPAEADGLMSVVGEFIDFEVPWHTSN